MSPGTLVAVAGGAAVLAALAGCNSQALSRQEQVESLLARTLRLEDELLAARERLAQVSGQAEPAPAAPAPEDPFRAVAIRFGRFTGGLDVDGKPGAERLKVVLEPLDAEGDVVKRAGSLVLRLYEPQGDRPRLLKEWQWPAEELAKAWLSGPGLYAYVLKLAWPGDRPPAAARLLLAAEFTTLPGERLAAEREILLERGGQE